MDSCFFHYSLTYNTSLVTYFLKHFDPLIASLTMYSSCFTISPTYLHENCFIHLHNIATSTFEALYPLKHPARNPWSHCLQNTLNTHLWKFLKSQISTSTNPWVSPNVINFPSQEIFALLDICSPECPHTPYKPLLLGRIFW